jgi:CyaY protein
MESLLDEQSYSALANAELTRLLAALDRVAAQGEDFEAEFANDIITLEFADGSKFVINSHRAARQIWMAAGSHAWHFDFSGAQWLATKTQQELWAVITEQLSRKLGRALQLPPPT